MKLTFTIQQWFLAHADVHDEQYLADIIVGETLKHLYRRSTTRYPIERHHVVFDFKDIDDRYITPSFVKLTFGALFEYLKPSSFGQHCKFINMSDSIKKTIDHNIVEYMFDRVSLVKGH